MRRAGIVRAGVCVIIRMGSVNALMAFSERLAIKLHFTISHLFLNFRQYFFSAILLLSLAIVIQLYIYTQPT